MSSKSLLASVLLSVVVGGTLGYCTATARADHHLDYEVHPGAEYIIEDSPGGVVSQFDKEFARLDGMNIRIRGYCASSCTRVLFEKFRINVCAEDTAVFMFHMEYEVILGRFLLTGDKHIKTSEKSWATKWLPNFPPVVRTFLKNKPIPNASRSGDINETYDVKGTRLIKRCED